MRAHAIVIGIDHYSKPEWCLTGAVRDAVAFARWSVTAGGVDPKDLTLLLSPLPDAPPLTELLKADQGAPDLVARAKSADWKSIAATFSSYQNGAGKDAPRLWFYYAGHGLAAPMQAPDAGPLVVPADVDDIDFYINMQALGLETFRGRMEDIKPKEQFFFIDACRDVLPTTGKKVLSQQLLWDVRGVDDDDLATQNLFLATTAGHRAKEIRGQGLFGRALLAALRGLGPELSNPIAPPALGQRSFKRLLFNDVVKFVIEAVKRALKDLPGGEPADLKGVPYARVNRLTGDIAIAEFAADALPKAKVGALVEPAAARPSARIEFLQFNDELGEWTPRTANPAPIGPGVPEVATFEVRGGSHWLRITADGFEVAQPEIFVYEDKRFPIELQPRLIPLGGVLRAAEESFESIVSIPKTATIIVTCADSLARVAVFDGQGKELKRNYGRVEAPNLVPGPYRVSAELTSEDRIEQTVSVHAGETKHIPLDVAAVPVGEELSLGLNAINISHEGNYYHPSEHFGPVANVRLGSILAYAAWAARWPKSERFELLRAMGVDPMPSLPSNGSALQVLIGDAAEKGAPFAHGCRVQVESADRSPLLPHNAIVLGSERADIPMSLTPLQKFDLALQASAQLPPGPFQARVEMPGFTPTSFALTLLSKFVTVLVISREENGEVDVQQYLNPIDPFVPAAPGFDQSRHDDVRLVELAWRALQGRDPLDAIEYDGLLHAKRSNPLLGIIAGYRMFRTEREDQFRVTPEPPINEGRVGPSPLWNMVYLFPDLPDVHVLAGLYDPERRDQHFEQAMDTGTPVLVEGFWALTDWLTQRAISAGTPAPTLRQSVMPGMVWTSFVEAEPAQRIETVHAVAPTGRNYAGRPPADLVAMARSVGRLEISDEASDVFLCTAFLLAPRLLICPIHFATKFAQEQPDGTWTMQKGARVRFDLSDDASEREVERPLRTLRPPNPLDANGGTLNRSMLDHCWPVVLLLSESAAAPSLGISQEAPEIGQPVSVIGFPRSDARIPSPLFAQHFAGSAGEKHVMPGSVLRSPGESWTVDYDCFTADGVSGGPVVDLESGLVVGMHVAASAVTEGRKRSTGIVVNRFGDELLSLTNPE